MRSPFVSIPLILLAVGCWAGACTLPSGDSSPTEGQVESDMGRSPFRPLDLPETPVIISDPVAFAQDRFTPREPVGSRYHQTLQVLTDRPEQVVILVSQTGLQDDSVQAIRTRLEFIPAQGDQWLWVWQGQQYICHRDRGQQDWAADLCS